MGLKYVASYLLAVAAGNESPSKSDLKKILDSIGSEVDDEPLEGLLSAVEGKSVPEIINSGLSKIQNQAACVAVPAAAVASSSASAAAPEAKQEAPAEEEEEEDDMGFSLFD